MGFLVGDTGGYNLATDFPGWTTTSNPLILTTTVAANNPSPYLVITFNSKVRKKVSLAISADAVPWAGCAVTQAEWTLADNWCQWGGLQDTYDISLVNGFNTPMKITPVSGQEITVSAGTGNSNNPGVFGWGWTGCNCAPPPLACTPMAGENHTPACPATPVPKCQLSQASVANYTLTISP